MARPRTNSSGSKGKGTSFGKKTDSEKAFRKRGSSSRSESFDSKRPSRPYNSSAGGDDRPNKFRSGPEGFKRRDEGASGKPTFKRSSSSFNSSDKPVFRKPDGKTFGVRSGSDRDKGDFKKRESGASFGARKSGSRYSDGDQEKRPFQKRESSFGSRPDRPSCPSLSMMCVRLQLKKSCIACLFHPNAGRACTACVWFSSKRRNGMNNNNDSRWKIVEIRLNTPFNTA